MQRSLIVAIIGAILPSFYISVNYNIILVFSGNISGFFGLGWLFTLFSGFGTSGNYLGIYALDPRIFYAPNDFNAFNGTSTGARSAYVAVETFFSDFLNSGSTSNLSIYGILFTLSIVITIIGIIILLYDKKMGGIILIGAGALALLSLLLYFNALNQVSYVSNVLPIPIGSVVLIIAGVLGIQEASKTGRSRR